MIERTVLLFKSLYNAGKLYAVFYQLLFNRHVKHSTAVLLFGIVLKYYFLAERMTHHYFALLQWVVSEVYAEPLLFTSFSSPVFCPWSLLTSQKSTEHHLLLMMLQASTTRYIQHNYTPMQAIGVLSHEGLYKLCSYQYFFSVLSCCDNYSQENWV